MDALYAMENKWLGAHKVWVTPKGQLLNEAGG
jgi:hypothetical protein